MKRFVPYILMFLGILLADAVFGQQEDVVRIGLHGGRGITKVNVQANGVTYQVVGDQKVILTLHPNNGCTFTPSGDAVQVSDKNKVLGKFKRVVLKSMVPEGSFRLQASSGTSNVKNTVYPDHLIIRSQSNKLILVNEALLDHYIAGVTEAEAGKGHELEYYKVQAMIARTYGLANLKRHATQGFNLCDEVHCQAYKGQTRFEPLIPIATKATEDQVLVDANIQLITAAFHSNCGGQTLNSEHVWSRPLPYLVGRVDTFCYSMPHSQWEHTVNRNEWLTYLRQKSAYRPDAGSDSTDVEILYESERPLYYADRSDGLKLAQVRNDWGLKSAFFKVMTDGDRVRFMGRGFGHGVGLCQEGAMRMALFGMDCREILHFYYENVHIINRRHISFFAE